MTRLTVAAVQMRSGTEIAANVEAAERLIRDAASQGATYVQTPEMTGAVQRDREALLSEAMAEADDPVVAMASSLAKELSVTIHIGSTAIATRDGKLANRSVVFGPDGALQARYDKIHMFDVDLDHGESWRESATYEPGDRQVGFDLGGTMVGLSICYDLRFPHLYRALAMGGASILAVPAAFTRQTGAAHWHILLRARAIENGAFVIAAAQGGQHEDGRETFGHSMIVDPWGGIVAEKDDDEPGVLVAEIDLERSVVARRQIPNLSNGREFSVDGTRALS